MPKIWVGTFLMQKDFELILTVIMGTRHLIKVYLEVNFLRSVIIAAL